MANQSEKLTDDTMHVEDIVRSPQAAEANSEEMNTLDKTEDNQENASHGFTPEEQKRIMRKVDWRVVPLLTFLYLVSFIDRSNSRSSFFCLLNAHK
jgi:hypothetical protein